MRSRNLEILKQIEEILLNGQVIWQMYKKKMIQMYCEEILDVFYQHVKPASRWKEVRILKGRC